MRRCYCEECFRPIPSTGCPDHPFAQPLHPERPDEAELIRAVVRTRQKRRQLAGWLGLLGLGWLGLAVPMAEGAGVDAVVSGLVLSGVALVVALAAALPVLAVLWLGGGLAQDLWISLRQRSRPRLHGPSLLLPAQPVVDALQSAALARDLRHKRREGRQSSSTIARPLYSAPQEKP